MDGDCVLRHSQHPNREGYFVHLAAELQKLHCNDLYHDTVFHCKDGKVFMNRLLTALIFPNLVDFSGFSYTDKIHFIIPVVLVNEMKASISNFLEVKDESFNSLEEEFDSLGDGFESDMVKAELKESPDADVNIDVKEECNDENSETSPSKYKWSCYICKESFRFAEHLSTHALEQHNTDRPYQCSFCPFTSREKGQLMRHENTHTRANQVSCEICGKSFLDARDLRNHKTVHSDERNMQCEYCDKMFKSDLYLNRHVKLMHSDNPVGEFECKICQKLFKTKDYLNRHNRKVHGDPRFYVCSFCGKNFKSASHRKDHEEIHRGEADAECEICGAQVRKKNLDRHMKTHSDEADFTCELCAKPLKTIEAFRAHMNSHVLPFKCEFCEKAFSTKYSMKSHTVQQHLLKKEPSHSKSREPKPMFQCDRCDYQCTTNRYMKTHKSVKHDGLFHKCSECDFTTGDLGSLRSHKRAKHEGVVYSCDLCDFKSGYKNNLKNHKAVAHFTVDISDRSKPKDVKPLVESKYMRDTEAKHPFPFPISSVFKSNDDTAPPLVESKYMRDAEAKHPFPFPISSVLQSNDDTAPQMEDRSRYWIGNDQ